VYRFLSNPFSQKNSTMQPPLLLEDECPGTIENNGNAFLSSEEEGMRAIVTDSKIILLQPI